MEEVKEKKNPFKIILKVIGNIILYLFLITAISGVILTATGKRDSDGSDRKKQ